MESKQAFGGYIKEKRQAKGLSQRDLAQKLYVTESAVSKWERGVSYPDITQITPLCEALDVSEQELVTASDDERQRRMERVVETHQKVRLAWLIVSFRSVSLRHRTGCCRVPIASVVHARACVGEIRARHGSILLGIPLREPLDVGGVRALRMGWIAEFQPVLRGIAVRRVHCGVAVRVGVGGEALGCGCSRTTQGAHLPFRSVNLVDVLGVSHLPARRENA